MLETIGLENFKGFQKVDELKIKPITILCGINSCGKSSILQSILLFKQTLESKNPKQMLLLNGRFVRLGMFKDIVFEQRSENIVTLKFRFKASDFSSIWNVSVFSLLQHSMRNKGAEYIIDYEISLGDSGKIKTESFLRPTIYQVIFKLETKTSDGTVIPGIDICIKLIKDDVYDVQWKNIEKHFGIISITDNNIGSGSIRSRVIFANLFPLEISAHNEAGTSDVVFAFYKLNSLLQNIFDSYTYIGPLREEPSRRYTYEDEIVEIGNKGENAAYIYLSEQDKPIENHYFYEANGDYFKKQQASLPLSEALSKWLDLMKIRELKPESTNEIIYLKLNSSSGRKTRVNIADVGFGVSQIFPILLEGLRMPERHTLLLEQPEIHLHPNLQMEMADYFIALALSNKRVIAETHSDHVINRLVRRMVEDKTNRLKELIGIYFITADENEGVKFEEVSIGKSGIENWPKEFFDQTANEQEKTILASMHKREVIRQETGHE